VNKGCSRRNAWTPISNRFQNYEPITSYGKHARKLVAAFEKGDLIIIRELGCRTNDTTRIYDVLWWMKRSKAAQAARLAARQQRVATRRLFNE
jgi:hypothetical protein